ncbi:class I adenylate-forming enzyme family protein [Sphaerisporangium rhizosphaerae]|uniref:Class I adenylate-forming enzyme family protein n=1 Tax=Sphaerisporangium rhizosphaerae TaxID=2269375 RepID=A0ABW2PFA2_9ACTN
MNDVVTGVLETARRAPGGVAVIDGRGATLTYGELRRRVLAVAEAMTGLRPGDGVLFAARPGPDAVALALGAVAAGGMLVLADPGLAPDVAAARLATAVPAWVVADSVAYTLSGPLRALARHRGLALPHLRDPAPGRPVRHLYAGPWLPGVPRDAIPLRAVYRASSPHPAPLEGAGPFEDPGPPGRDGPAARPDQPAVVAFTSGTTGRPRGVVHTRGSLAEGSASFGSAVPLAPGDVVHTDQLMLGLPALMAGATWSLPGARPFASELAERGATHAFCVPVRLDRILREDGRLPGTLRCLLLGTAPSPPAVLRRARAAAPRARIWSVYAMTEALPIAIVSAEEKLACREGDLLGAPLPGVAARIAADGELYISGPQLARGYIGEPPLREVATGDLARLDEQGRLVLLGRKKDMILRNGVNIYPGLYEPALAALPGVAEAAIVGVADPETGDEEVVLAVRPDEGFDAAALRRALPDRVDAGALPDRVEVLPDFPRAGRTDKLDRARLRAAVARHTGGGGR